MDYEVTFAGEIRDSRSAMNLKVCAVTSLCLLEKDFRYGAHNQRST